LPLSLPEEAMLPILYRDEHLIAIHKPAGLLVHRSPVDRHETRFAVQMLRDQIGQWVYPAHRLDRGTSGVLLFALNRDMARALGQQFEQQSVEKTYMAVVRGYPEESGEIDHPLSRQFDDMEWQGEHMSHEPQAALTRYRRLATVELPIQVDRYPSSRYALLELAPATGRQHQLRRHLKHIAHPIIGDATYGKGRHNRFFAEHFGCKRLLLACWRLVLQHPANGTSLVLDAPLDGDFARLMETLGWAHSRPGLLAPTQD